MFDTTVAPALADIPLERLEAEICLLAARSTAAMYRWLSLLGEFDRREGHATWGLATTSAWVAWKCAIDARTARDHVRVGRCLPSLPVISARFSTGELSYSKVRALTRIATPESEAELVEFALTATTSQLERAVRAYRSAVAGDEGDRGSRTDRLHFEAYHDTDGTVRVSGRLPAAEGAVFIAALDEQAARVAEDRWTQRSGGSAEPPSEILPVRVEAAIAMAEAARHAATPEMVDDRYLVLVHVVDDGSAHVDDGSPVPPSVLDRLSCGGLSQTIVEDGAGNPLFLGRRRRLASSAQRQAVAVRDQHRCRWPGCTAKTFLKVHHVNWWERGGRTDVDELALLCHRHHALVHEGGFTMERVGPGRFVFRRPDGARIEPVPAAPAVPADDDGDDGDLPASVDAPAGGTGERMNLDDAVTGLLCVLRPDLVLGRAG